MPMNIPETFKIVQGQPPTTTNGALVSDYINLKNAHMVTAIIELKQAATHETAFTINEATDVTPTGATAVTAVQKIWVNDATGTTDTLVRQTDAVGFTVSAVVADKQIVIEIDPATLTDTFDCIAIASAASSESTNFSSVTFIIETRYPQATPPSAIID